MDDDTTYRHCPHCLDYCSDRDEHGSPCPVEDCPGRMPLVVETEG